MGFDPQKTRCVAVANARDQDGLYLGSRSIVIKGTKDPGTAETTAIREALSLVVDLNLSSFVCM